jgi:hypothetical protein
MSSANKYVVSGNRQANFDMPFMFRHLPGVPLADYLIDLMALG